MRNRIFCITACALILMCGCKTASAPLPPWAPNAQVATAGSVISAANNVVVGYEQDQKDCAANAALTKCPGVSSPAIHKAVQDIQQALVVAQPQFNSWETAVRQDPAATEPANLAAAISTIQAVLAQFPSLTGK